MSAKNPGELSALDRGILRLVSPAQSAMSFVARAIAGVAGRFVELTHVRAENEELAQENARLRAELTELRRLADESGALPAPARPARPDAGRDDRGAHHRDRRLAVLPRRARRARSRRRHRQTRHAGAHARGRRGPHRARVRQDVRHHAARRSSVRDRHRRAAHGRPRHSARQGGRQRLPLQHRVPDARRTRAGGRQGRHEWPRRRVPARSAPWATSRPCVPGAVGLFQEVEVTPDVDFARLSEVLVVAAPPPAPIPTPAPPRRRPPARGPMVYNEGCVRSRDHADRRLPAADPAVDGAGARARAHGGAQPGPAGRACTWACRTSGASRRRRSWRSRRATCSIWCRARPRACTRSCSCSMALFARALSMRVAVRASSWRRRRRSSRACSRRLLIVIVRAQVAPEGGYGGLRQAPLEALLTASSRPLCSGSCAASTARSTPPARASACARGPAHLGDNDELPLTHGNSRTRR